MNQTPTLATVHSLSDHKPNRQAKPSAATERELSLERSLLSAIGRGDDAHHMLTHQLSALLSLCEFASLAHAALAEIVSESERDPTLAERLNKASPGWSDCLERADTLRNIGRCMALARATQERASGELQALADAATYLTEPGDE